MPPETVLETELVPAASPRFRLRPVLQVGLSVLAVIAVAVGSAFVVVYPSLQYARLDTTRQSAATIATGVDLFRQKHGAAPQSIEDLIRDGFLTRVPKDGWDSQFDYWTDGARSRITSYGADGAPGGEDENADLTVEGPK